MAALPQGFNRFFDWLSLCLTSCKVWNWEKCRQWVCATEFTGKMLLARSITHNRMVNYTFYPQSTMSVNYIHCVKFLWWTYDIDFQNCIRWLFTVDYWRQNLMQKLPCKFQRTSFILQFHEIVHVILILIFLLALTRSLIL